METAARRGPTDPPRAQIQSAPGSARFVTRWLHTRWAPTVLLIAVCGLSLGARAFWLDEPCHARCTTANDHLLIFDEVYYVNTARVIAGMGPPADAHYAGAPLGDDPNSEHPQGVKLIIAGAIKLFGDGPLAWRIGSLVVGTLAIAGMWALVLAVGGGEWTALAPAALMAADNLLLVAGRIGTLDIYAVAAMVWAVAFYLRGRWFLGGLILGIGTACKELAPLAIVVVVLFELFGLSPRPRGCGQHGGASVGSSGSPSSAPRLRRPARRDGPHRASV